MRNFSRKQNIILSASGLAVVIALLVYYLLHDELWKKEIHIGFAGLTGLLIYRLVRSFKQEEKEEERGTKDEE